MAPDGGSTDPEGVMSLLDTDLYKLTMQSAVFKFFRDVHTTYALTNRTPHMRFSRKAFRWLGEQIAKLSTISLTAKEHDFLRTKCDYLDAAYLDWLCEFRLKPDEHVTLTFQQEVQAASRAEVTPKATTEAQKEGKDRKADVEEDVEEDEEMGAIVLTIQGRWVDTILYEIPILALASEAYFKFVDTDWDYDGQAAAAWGKAERLLAAGCAFTDFGTRRRRNYRTQALVLEQLALAATAKHQAGASPGRLLGTSNVHLAMRYDLAPIGTVAHEWFMGIGALTDDYGHATERALCCWILCFGAQLGITLTDTYGTTEFLEAFSLPFHPDVHVLAQAHAYADPQQQPQQPQQSQQSQQQHPLAGRAYADIFAGVRQDSGSADEFVAQMRRYYNDGRHGYCSTKTIIFSDSLNVDKCLRYKQLADQAGFQASFGIGTHLTNDFVRRDGSKSVPLNLVIKLSSAGGRPAVKLSDTIGKNTGDRATIERVKKEVGYLEHDQGGGRQ